MYCALRLITYFSSPWARIANSFPCPTILACIWNLLLHNDFVIYLPLIAAFLPILAPAPGWLFYSFVLESCFQQQYLFPQKLLVFQHPIVFLL